MKIQTLILLLLLAACSRYPQDVEDALKLAGENRVELQQVLDHYQATGETEKLKAACFLIGNLDDKYAVGIEYPGKYDPVFSYFQSLWQKRLFPTSNSVFVKAKVDSLFTASGGFNRDEFKIIPDIKTIKADYLIQNIDLAFAIRDSVPWGHQFSFDQFCEYVLAFRFSHEPIENWRRYYYEKYLLLRDTIRHDSCYYLAAGLHKNIERVRSLSLISVYPFDFTIDQLETGRVGVCKHITTYTAQLMRAAGIPTAIDYTPAWGDQGGSHSWNTIQLENGKMFHYEGSSLKFGQDLVYRVAKIYRKTFGRQETSSGRHEDEIPVSIRNDHMIDVTPEYTETFNIKVPLTYSAPVRKKYAIICSHNNKTWTPQNWGEIKKGKALFRNMGQGNLYISMYYDNRELVSASEPFILDENGKLNFISPDFEERQDMLLLRKYPLRQRIQDYHDDLVNCMFQGANRDDFRDSVILHTITSSPNHIETVTVDNPNKYRYVRFAAPVAAKGDVAEIEFYGGDTRSDTIKLTGKPIGFPEVFKEFGTPYQNAFDGNIDTYFHGYYSGNLWWAGLDLGKPKVVTKIRYCPRSDTNFIVEGHRYELCYWDKDGWVSMGEQAAKKPFLEYSNVPSKGLYILHNLTKGKEERIFTYNEGKQIFW